MAKYKIIPSSRTIVQSPISIGHKAEKGVEAIEFDLTAWVETYGSGTATIIMRRWGDAIPYPIALEIDENNKATWTLSDIDTAKAGMAYAQLNYIVGDEVVKKSDIYTFRVMDSLTGEGEPPEAYESWLEHLTHLAAEAMAEVLDIEGIVTDKTLTVDGGIADGKATGDALALKADKSTTYTKAEVDQMIEDVEVETDTTLSVSGAPADAAETGRQFGLIKADLDAIETSLLSQIEYSQVANKAVNSSTGELVQSSTYCCTDHIDVSKYTILLFARVGTTSANADKGTAFYDDTKTFISESGIPNLINQAQLGYTEYSVAIPKTAKYVRFTYIRNNADGFFVKGVPFVDEEVEEIKNVIVGKRVPITPTYTTETGYIRYSDGEFISGGSAFATSMIDVSAYEQMEYPRLYSMSSSSSAGIAFYDENGVYVDGERCSLNNETLHYVPTKIKIPTDAKYARFTGNDNATGDFVFADLTSVYNSFQGQIDNVNELIDDLIYVPSKKVSILGDSISTFALEAGTGSGDKYAGQDCKTNYPGNRVRYPFNDVLNVNQMWWKIVFDYFGWELGINESWAGSRIAWTGVESTTTGENIYIGSPTRIGHLDDNGTPDLIFIFGGTNDINHLGTSNIGELPTEDPTRYTQSDLDTLPVDKFKDAVVAMILRIQYVYPNAQIIALLPYFVNWNYSTTPYTVKQFDDALIEVYDYLGVDYIDLRKIVNIYDISTLLGDSLHPNANGMKLIAEAVIHKIKNIIQISSH